MPELAEVEYFRKLWNPGLGQKVVAVQMHAAKRIFRGVKTKELQRHLTGATLLESFAHGKQMMFRFSSGWMALHLGMTGELRCEPLEFEPGKHDHLVLCQAKQCLVFADPRQFGSVEFEAGSEPPDWWKKLPPQVFAKEFTPALVAEFLARRKAAPIKAVLLMQERFPGIGNWMADEILWQAGVNPARKAGKLSKEEVAMLHRCIQAVSRTALKTEGVTPGNLPKNWLFDRRWKKGGSCPKDGTGLKHAEVGGRTTCWCPKCQRR